MRRAAISIIFVMASLVPALAQSATKARQRQTPDWPCVAIKVPEISLPAVWNGPALDGIPPGAWREDPALAELVPRLALRRIPLEEAEAAVKDFAAKSGAAKREKLLVLFAGLFETMAQERATVVAGLERFGRRQKELADQIRAETADMRAAMDQGESNAAKTEELTGRLTWDMRIFEDKRKSVSFVCETPVLIEQRLFALGRAIQGEFDPAP